VTEMGPDSKIGTHHLPNQEPSPHAGLVRTQ
jgi:hypothetical protein